MADVTSQEIKEHRILAKKVQDQFENDINLLPINPDLEGPPPDFGERLSDKIAEFGGKLDIHYYFLHCAHRVDGLKYYYAS